MDRKNELLEEENRRLKQLLQQEQENRVVELERLRVLANNIPYGTLFRYKLDINTGKRYMTYVGDKWEEVTGIPASSALSNVYEALVSIIDSKSCRR